jgi:RNA polymerase sigma-70 factor (ECF subfamily)
MSAAHHELVDWEPQLVRRAADGDCGAFESLYRQHLEAVYGLCLRLTRDVAAAEDSTQEVFIRAWRALKRFEARSSFATWLHRIAVNVVLNRRRQPFEWLPEEGGPFGSQPERLDWTFDTPVEVVEIERAIDELPQGARDAVVLCGLYGYSPAEVASMLGLAEGTCKAQLHRARVLLRRRLNLETPNEQ